MNLRDAVAVDLNACRTDLHRLKIRHQNLLKLNPWRPVCDAAVDWVVVVLMTALVVHWGWWLSPFALLVIGNRQRALGNILHDAGHGNLHRTRAINDSIARAFIAPAMFVSLRLYRTTHFQHHRHLGHAQLDPDFMRPASRSAEWIDSFRRHTFAWPLWWDSLAGHLGARQTNPASRVFIVAWWSLLLSIACGTAGVPAVIVFSVLWLAARGTTFHLITRFREMCDHFGLQPGGVLSFTRDIEHGSVTSLLIHPRNNGYHLTHHLMPAVPYYRLPASQRLLRNTPTYQRHGRVHRGYVRGPAPVVADWCSPA